MCRLNSGTKILEFVGDIGIVLNNFQPALHVVWKCSWKGVVLNWKVRNETRKNKVGKLEPKLESTTEVGNSLENEKF